MSGSGPSVFGLFARGGAGAAYRTLQSEGIPAWICHPVTASES
jgi:4-diphosphocytidyl-2C-methyl-D-erythritol kinase